MRTLADLDPTDVATATQTLSRAERLVVLTGAGISTDSGIPDYRGPNGVWTKNPSAEKAAHISTFVADADHRRQRWQRLVEAGSQPPRQPNRGHRALADPSVVERLALLVTQNVDGLHRRAGSPVEKLVEVHGTILDYKCLSCEQRGPIDVVLDRVRAGEDDPHCDCGGLLKAATVSFGEALRRTDLVRSHDAATSADVLLCVGTTLAVNPIAQIAPVAAANGASLIIVNAEPTMFDHLADVVLAGSITEVLPVILGVDGTLDP